MAQKRRKMYLKTKFKKGRLLIISIIVLLSSALVFIGIYFKKMYIEDKTNEYLLGITYMQQMANIMLQEKKVTPLYQLYERGLFPLQAFTTLHSPEFEKAIYWDTLSLQDNTGMPQFVSKEIFDAICCITVECENGYLCFYDRNNKRIKLRLKWIAD